MRESKSEQPMSVRDCTRVDKITPGTAIAFLRSQQNLYMPLTTKGKPDVYRMIQDFDTGERIFITVDSSGEFVTDVMVDEEMENEKRHIWHLDKIKTR